MKIAHSGLDKKLISVVWFTHETAALKEVESLESNNLFMLKLLTKGLSFSRQDVFNM